DVDQVTWDVSGIQPSDHIHADLVLLPLSANPIARRMTLTAQANQLCDAKHIERAILVVSNGDLSSSASGRITARGTSLPCSSTGITFTSVQPSTVTANDHVVTFRITGSGFATLDPGTVLLGGRN